MRQGERVDLTDSGTAVTLISGLALLVGVAGVLIPVLPGLLLCWLAVAFWAVLGPAGPGRWIVLVVATLLAVTGTVIKYLWPGRSLRRSAVPTRSLLAGGALGLVGFFVVPIVGLLLGFVGGVFLAERARLGDNRLAWPSTRHAVRAVGLSMAVEFAAAVLIAVTWLAGVILA